MLIAPPWKLSPGSARMTAFNVDEKTFQIYNDSFEYCLSKEGFLPRFYELFIGASPEVREKFKDTDFQRQVRIFKKSLYVLTMASVGTDEARKELVRLGQIHGREGLNIPPDMYDLWLDCLIRAVRECHTEWHPDIERSWREMLGPHIAVLKSYS
jgi:hemoglobin-like flavoprotein